MRNKTGIILCICLLAGTVAGCGLEASDATVLGNDQTLVTGENAGGIVSPELDVPEIYQDVLRQYEQAIGECEDIDTFYKRQESGEWPDVYNYLMACALDMDIYYCLRDVTDDGFPELIIGLDNPDVIYYYNEDQGRIIMVHISGGYYILNLYEGGVVTQEDGDGNGTIAYYQFQPDIKWWELIIWRKLDRGENPRYYRYSGEESDVTEEVPEEEARQIIDQLTKERIELEWILLDVL